MPEIIKVETAITRKASIRNFQKVILQVAGPEYSDHIWVATIDSTTGRMSQALIDAEAAAELLAFLKEWVEPVVVQPARIRPTGEK